MTLFKPLLFKVWLCKMFDACCKGKVRTRRVVSYTRAAPQPPSPCLLNLNALLVHFPCDVLQSSREMENGEQRGDQGDQSGGLATAQACVAIGQFDLPEWQGCFQRRATVCLGIAGMEGSKRPAPRWTHWRPCVTVSSTHRRPCQVVTGQRSCDTSVPSFPRYEPSFCRGLIYLFIFVALTFKHVISPVWWQWTRLKSAVWS